MEQTKKKQQPSSLAMDTYEKRDNSKLDYK